MSSFEEMLSSIRSGKVELDVSTHHLPEHNLYNLACSEMPKLNTSLTPTQARFALWLDERMPYLLPLFDLEKAVYLPEAVDRYFGVASRGEEVRPRFV